VTPGINCRSVTGTFAAEALAKQDNGMWGGSELSNEMSTKDAVAKIPGEITDWKLYLAKEYERYFRAGAPARPAPASTPVQPIAPAPTDNGGGNRNGNGNNGNGNGRD
jgi:hypothetical protein